MPLDVLRVKGLERSRKRARMVDKDQEAGAGEPDHSRRARQAEGQKLLITTTIHHHNVSSESFFNDKNSLQTDLFYQLLLTLCS